jgi:outer membrane protein assembly factor BamB
MIKKLTLLLAIIFSTQVFTQEVAQWRGDTRDGIYNETGLLKSWPEGGPELLWHFDGLGNGHASAAVTSDVVYTAGTQGDFGYIFAFDHSGNLLWKMKYGEEWVDSYPGVRSTPLVYNNKLYIMSGLGELYCMDAKDGKIIWQINLITDYGCTNIKWGVTENLAFLDDKIFCTPGGEEHNVIALNKDSGELIWTSKGKGETSAYCSPQLANHNGTEMLITQTANSIIGLDALTGEFLWSTDQPNQWSVHANTPYYRDGFVYCVSGYGKGGVMIKLSDDGRSAEEVWRNESLDGRMGGFIVLDDKIWGPGDKGVKWYCLDWNSGEELVVESLIKKGNITYADGMLYLYGEDGKVALADPTDTSYNIVSQFSVPYGEDQHWAFPVIFNKRLYVRHGTSLMVYDIAAE